ncbi:NAD(P)H-dependent oxidoreductase [Candidatus Poribacteria bacterium]|nr:NAD(P)H-dependent oxidoreductase [Candidatus Poribacteria bacterium]MYF56173.1 NAD(P)H-dependent oxidoreductase [Candidatus Poribacteria bacterium]
MSYSKKHPINVIGLCGSLRKGSTTHAALTIALKGAEENGASVELLDLSEYELIFYGAVDEKSDYPPDVIKLKQKVAAAHGVLLGTPEYHGSFSGVIKNTLDLMGSEEFQNKIVGLIGVSGGRMGAGNALSMLRIVCTSLRAWVVPNDVSIARASEAFDENGCLNDDELEMRLRTIGEQVAEYAARWNLDYSKVNN